MDQPEVISLDAGPVALGARSWPGGAGRPVLLVHGLSANARLWDGVGERLAAAGHPVVAADLRGHGSSAEVPDVDPGVDPDDPDAAPTDPTHLAARDLAALCSGLGWTAPVVAGHAWGGNIALQLAADHPDLVHGLVLVDGGWLHLGDQWPTLDAAWDVLAPPRFDGMSPATLRSALRAGHPGWPDAGVDAAMGSLRERADGTVAPWLDRERHRAAIGSLLRHRPRTLYPAVHCPVLLLAATGDRTPPRKRAQLTEAMTALATAELTEFPGGDHDLHVQHPARVADLIGTLTR